jgi:SAM-dependent methyltransferase
MKPYMMGILVCDHCRGELVGQQNSLVCQSCDRIVPLENGIPIFTSPPQGIRPSEKLVRGPHVGTPWRQANWRFLEAQVRQLESRALILDVGAGRGDFADLFHQHPNYLALDIYPYPEVDIVCDLTQANPLRAASLDAILLMNVLEHIYSPHTLLGTLAELLKPGGVLIVAIPFLVKMHQVPLDYARYTHFTLQRFAADHSLEIIHLEGFYDPVSVLTEGIGNLKNAVLPELTPPRRLAGRLISWALQAGAAALRGLHGPGQVLPPDRARSQAPTGYHLVYRKR